MVSTILSNSRLRMKILVILTLLVLGWSRASLVNIEDCSSSVPSEKEFPMEVDRVVPFDVFIGDIQPRDHMIIAKRSGSSPSLDDFNNGTTFPAKGVVYGDQKRAFVALAVKKEEGSAHQVQDEKARTVLFLVGGGAPQTFLRPETMAALGCKDESPCRVSIHGYPMYVHVGSNRHTNVDLLGTDYVSNIQATVSIDYKTLTVRIDSTFMEGYEEL